MLLFGSVSIKEHRSHVDSFDIDLSFFTRKPKKKGIKRQSDGDSVCGSTMFCSDDFIQNIFKIDAAIVEICKVVQNA